MNKKEIIENLIENIMPFKPQKIILFGSHARDEIDELSDIDIVIIKDTEKRFLERLKEVALLIDNKFGKVDVFVYTPEEFKRMVEWENPFIENVLREGKVVYETK